MASQVFIWLLGVLTALTGVVLVVMVLRRRRAHRLLADRPRRAIDDYATYVPPTTESRGETPADADDELAKICPACGSRYGHQFRTCARDDNELAALN